MAVLVIPGALNRTRTFDVDAQLSVRLPAPSTVAHYGLSLEVDGSLQWSRTLQAGQGGADASAPEVDGLDYHCRLVVPPGRDTRLRVKAALRQCGLLALSLSAVEVRDL